jgi:Tripartite tricarboxylate transporter TctB family
MKADQWTSLFWLVLSIFVGIESLRMGIGTFHSPGMGFMFFGGSVLLAFLSLVLLLQSSLKKEGKEAPLFAGKLWKRVFSVLIALFIYSKLLPLGGYLITTFLLMVFLFWIVKGQKWWWVLIFSCLTTLTTYFVFSVWLNCEFPEGLLGL